MKLGELKNLNRMRNYVEILHLYAAFGCLVEMLENVKLLTFDADKQISELFFEKNKIYRLSLRLLLENRNSVIKYNKHLFYLILIPLDIDQPVVIESIVKLNTAFIYTQEEPNIIRHNNMGLNLDALKVYSNYIFNSIKNSIDVFNLISSNLAIKFDKKKHGAVYEPNLFPKELQEDKKII